MISLVAYNEYDVVSIRYTRKRNDKCKGDHTKLDLLNRHEFKLTIFPATFLHSGDVWIRQCDALLMICIQIYLNMTRQNGFDTIIHPSNII